MLITILYPVIFFPLMCAYGNDLNCNEHQRCDKLDARRQKDSSLGTLPKWLDFCSCEDNCHQFGDCCENSEQIVNSNLSDWAILSINVSPQYRFYTLIKKKCSSEWRGHKIREACEKTGFSEEEDFLLPDFGHIISINEDEFLLWQVTSNRTFTTYRNIYCAVCNYELGSIESWRMKLSCVRDNLPTKCGQSLYAFPPTFLVTEKIKRKPLIQPHIYTGCNMAWYKSHVKVNKTFAVETIKNCARFYAPVVYQDNSDKKLIVFKNQYCAICSDYLQKDLICPARANQSYGIKYPSDNNIDVSFDTDFVNGGKIGNTGMRCNKDYVYDPFRKECRLVVLRDDDEPYEPEIVPTNRVQTTSSTTGRPTRTPKNVKDADDNEIPLLPSVEKNYRSTADENMPNDQPAGKVSSSTSTVPTLFFNLLAFLFVLTTNAA